jgi:hypothetical protein
MKKGMARANFLKYIKKSCSLAEHNKNLFKKIFNKYWNKIAL